MGLITSLAGFDKTAGSRFGPPQAARRARAMDGARQSPSHASQGVFLLSADGTDNKPRRVRQNGRIAVLDRRRRPMPRRPASQIFISLLHFHFPHDFMMIAGKDWSNAQRAATLSAKLVSCFKKTPGAFFDVASATARQSGGRKRHAAKKSVTPLMRFDYADGHSDQRFQRQDTVLHATACRA